MLDYARDPHSFRGRVEMRPFASRALAANALGDPSERELPVYLPPGWDAPGARFPVVFVLSAFTRRPQDLLETHPWRPGVVLLYDRALALGRLPPAILVLPDTFTRLGGSQCLNSSATGAYEDYLVRELVPFVDATYPALPGARGVCGKSSGGFAALHLALAHPGLFRAVAALSADVCFEYCYGQELLACLRGLVPHGGDPARFLAAFAERPELSGDAHAVLNVLAMSACYSPNPASALGFDLPMDLRTGARKLDVWHRWLAFDPLERAAAGAAALSALELLYLECGLADEFHLQWGLRRFAAELERARVPHVHVEHPGGHRGLDARFLVALEPLLAALAVA